MYKVFYITAVKKDFKALPKEVNLLKEKYFSILSNNPFCGEPLTDVFKSYLSYHFSYQGTRYRIIYKIIKEKLIILIILIGSRENIYKRLKRRLL